MADDRMNRSEQSPNTPSKRRPHRLFSDQEKLHILDKADHSTKSGEVGLLLRKEGIYASHPSRWRRWRRRARREHEQPKRPSTDK